MQREPYKQNQQHRTYLLFIAKQTARMPPESIIPTLDDVPINDIENGGSRHDCAADPLRSHRRAKGGKHLRWCRITKEVEIKDTTR